jgi:uncharacterized delta-60 repeat protein
MRYMTFIICGMIAALPSWGQELDLEFGSGGHRRWDLGVFERFYDVDVAEDGRIVACGVSSLPGSPYWNVMVACMQDNGEPDLSFGEEGYVTVATGAGSSYGNDVLVLEDGRILVHGTTQEGTEQKFMLRRFLANGDVDMEFGTAGVLVSDLYPNGGYFTDMVLLEDGSTLLSGVAQTPTLMGAALLAKVRPDGTWDSDFGTNGVLVLDNTGEAVQQFANTLVVLPDGAILLGGYIRDLSDFDGGAEMAVWGITPDGSLIPEFADAGLLRIAFPAVNAWVERMALQSDGTIRLIGPGELSLQWSALQAVITDQGIPVSSGSSSLSAYPVHRTWEVVLGPSGQQFFLGEAVPNADSDGFLGQTRHGYGSGNTTISVQPELIVDGGEWTTFAGGTMDNSGRLIAVGLTTNPDWIGHFTTTCGLYTDAFIARFIIDNTTGTPDEQKPSNGHVWPVPSEGEVWLQGEEPITACTVRDAAGRTVHTTGPSPSYRTTMSLDLGHLAPGAYQVEFQCAEVIHTRTIVISK